MKTISFRINNEQHAELERCAELAGVSIHEVCRGLTLKALESERESELLRLELGKIGCDVSDLRNGLGKVTELLLFALGKVPLEHTRELVSDLLRGAA